MRASSSHGIDTIDTNDGDVVHYRGIRWHPFTPKTLLPIGHDRRHGHHATLSYTSTNQRQIPTFGELEGTDNRTS